jgi:hypothetical protein
MFTNDIWGESNGYRFIFTGKPGSKGMFKKAFTDNEAAYEYALRQQEAGLNVWYGVAIYNEPTKKEQANVKELRAFWLDMDIGKPGCYATQQEGALAVRDFVIKNDLPPPTVVSSGYGLHIYFLLTEAIEKLEWDKYAKALKKLVKAHGLKVDNGLTGDSARLLRLPGTRNFKNPDNPLTVKLVSEPYKIELDILRRALAPHVAQENVKAINTGFQSDKESLPSDAGLIAEACAQMRNIRDTRGNVAEPVWYAGLGILAYCTDGEKLAHEYSNGYPGYKQTETQEKFERSKEYGPTLCETFSDRNPDLCKGCPHYGKITTPLVLGRKVTALTPPINSTPQRPAPASLPVSPDTNGVAPRYPAPPSTYQVGAEGIFREDKEAGLIQVCPLPVWVVAHRLAKTGLEIELVWRTPLGAERRGVMYIGLLADKKKLAEWLYANGITMFRSPDEMKVYLEAAHFMLSKQDEATRQYDRFGWVDDDNFVIGNTLITPNGPAPAAIGSRIPARMAEGFTPVGAVEPWAEATRVLNRPGLWVHRFTLLAILGTPLFKLAGWSGAMLSLAGDSGVGKTTACAFGSSAYSSYRANEITTQSTDRAIYEQMYLAHNLAVVINESSTLQPYRVGNLVYAAVEGHARIVLTQKSEIRESEQWANLTVLTSNQHLTSLADKFLNEAQRYRILEISLDKRENLLTTAEAKTIYNAIEVNYGYPGQLYLKFLVENRKAVRGALDHAQELFKAKLPPAGRFMAWVIAVAHVTAQIAETLNLVNCGTSDAITGALAAAQKLASDISTEGQKVEDIVGNYINAHQSYFTRLENGNWTNPEIRGEVVGRYTSEPGNSTLAIGWQALVNYAYEYGIDKQNLQKWAFEVKKATIGNVKLSRDNFATRCLIIPSPAEGVTE